MELILDDDHAYVMTSIKISVVGGSESFQVLLTGRMMHPNSMGTPTRAQDPLRPHPVDLFTWQFILYRLL